MINLGQTEFNVLSQLGIRLGNWISEMPSTYMPIAPHLEESSDDDIKVVIGVSIAGSAVGTLTINTTIKALGQAAIDPVVFEDLQNTAKQKIKDLLSKVYYEYHYEEIFRHNFEDKNQLLLEATTRECRFCRRKQPEVSFRKRAHAVPEAVGNKTLRTRYECDVCNDFFGRTVEDDFGRWSNLQRTLFRVERNGGIPKFKTKSGSIEVTDESVTEIKVGKNVRASINPDTGNVNVQVDLPTFIPLAVLKAIYKMALTVMPESEVVDFRNIIDWVRNPNLSAVAPFRLNSSILMTYSGGLEHGYVVLFKRQTPDKSLPYMTFVLSFGDICYQAILPPGREKQEKNMIITPFYQLRDKEQLVSAEHSIVGLASCKKNDLQTSIITHCVMTIS